MNRFFFTGILLLLVASCSSTQFLPDSYEEENIPEEAEVIILVSRMPADSLFDAVEDSLATRGYMIAQSNKNLNALSTRARNIGNRIQMRMSFLIESLSNANSRMIVRSEWKNIQTIPKEESKSDDETDEKSVPVWKKATWNDPDNSRRAFAHMIQFVNGLPHASLSYN